MKKNKLLPILPLATIMGPTMVLTSCGVSYDWRLCTADMVGDGFIYGFLRNPGKDIILCFDVKNFSSQFNGSIFIGEDVDKPYHKSDIIVDKVLCGKDEINKNQYVLHEDGDYAISFQPEAPIHTDWLYIFIHIKSEAPSMLFIEMN